MLKKFLLLFFLIGLCSSLAQTYSRSLPSYQNKISKIENISEIKILAVMVEFQPDDFELTYGDGTFGSIYSEDYGNDIIDPLPHDKNYFEDHLEFAVNYFQRVSNEIVSVNYNILPDIVTVSKPMREYSPSEGESFKLLGDFSQEVWNLVDASNPGLDYSEYNTFVIFHAGVGKDISTSDLFGEARDLPSIFLGIRSLKEFYGDSFQGFGVGQNQYIDNTIILPETESREESGIGGTALIELSINGLIVSSLASRLGLPDLFDAETGKSAIGRFGLMDGQSLFAYAGLFPPEPSAWEKIYLGWENPVLLDQDTDNIIVTASRIAGASDNKIYKVPINATEYYLIENRNRDVSNDGITLTYKIAGEVRTINLSEDTDSFNNAFVDTMRGVVLDVDEFDWALPGNGLLIWHIDESIINEYASENKINVGDRKGVDLEEADGIQDIGEEFQTIFGDIIIAEGDEFDFWYSSNSSELYENEFGPATKPDTKTNGNANSLISFSAFSDIGNQMSFNLKFGSESIALMDKVEFDPSFQISDFKISSPQQNEISLFFTSENDLYLYSDSLFVAGDFSAHGISVFSESNKSALFGAVDDLFNVALFDGSTLSVQSLQISSPVTSPITIDPVSDTEVLIYAGLNNGSVQIFNYNISSGVLSGPNETIELFNSSIGQIIIDNGNLFAASENKIYFTGNVIEAPSDVKILTITKNVDNDYLAVALSENNNIYSYQDDWSELRSIFSSQEAIQSISLADLRNDGNNYIVFHILNEIYAINIFGNSADNFPINAGTEENLIGTPLIADINGDLRSDIISVGESGNVYSYSARSGKILDNFPLSTGGQFSGFNALSGDGNNLFLSSSTSLNQIFTWELSNSGTLSWTSKFGNNFNNSFLEPAETGEYISEYFPLNRTYNWPNPVYGNETNIRTYVSEDSNVDVKVFDIAGDLVDEFEFFASGGLDTEYSWNVENVESGAYFARLEVKSNSGKSETKIIKIAIVK